MSDGMAEHLQHQKNRKIFAEANEKIFDLVTEKSGGAPSSDAASLAWKLIIEEKLPCEEVANKIVEQGMAVVEPQARISEALDIAFTYGGFDGADHKAWTIDQMCRVLAGEKYREFVREYNGDTNEDGETEYFWDTGIAP